MSSNESDRPAEEPVHEDIAALMRAIQRRIDWISCRHKCTLCQVQCGRIGGAHTCLIQSLGELQCVLNALPTVSSYACPDDQPQWSQDTEAWRMSTPPLVGTITQTQTGGTLQSAPEEKPHHSREKGLSCGARYIHQRQRSTQPCQQAQ